MQAADNPRILLIDDDPIFCNLMAKVADSRGIPLDAYESLLDLGSVGMISAYDAAIIDYKLNDMTGIEIAEYLQAFFSDTPMVLVSSLDDEQIPAGDWPAPIAQYINKKAGGHAILQSAVAIANWTQQDEEKHQHGGRHQRHHRPKRSGGLLSR